MPTKIRRKKSSTARMRSHLTAQIEEVNFIKRQQILNMDLDGGRMTLASENITQTLEDPTDIYLKTFKKLKIKQRKLDHVLILGFGLGSIASLFKDKFKLIPNITAIEINPVIIDMSKRSLHPEVLENVHLIQDDVYEFIMKETRRFDLICFDIFQDTFIEDRFREEAFLEKLGNLMRTDAVLLYNTMSVNHKSELQRASFHRTTFSKLYPSSTVIESGANTIYIEDRHPFLGDA